MLSSLYMFHLPFPKAGAILPSVVALGRQGASCAAPTAFLESSRLGRTSKIIKSNLQLSATTFPECREMCQSSMSTITLSFKKNTFQKAV